MKKAICDKCNTLIEVDETSSMVNCPNCKAQIFTQTVIKNFYQQVSTFRKKADIAFTEKANYQEAYKNYLSYYSLMKGDLAALVSVVISKVRCSTVHHITIKEATDYLLKESDDVEVNYNNVHNLSDALIKIRKDSRLIVDTFNEVKNESNYALNMFKTAVSEYKYYLEKYLEIYGALTNFNKYFDDTLELINDEIKFCNRLLKAKIEVKNKSDAKHDFYNQKKQLVVEIFPNKIRFYKIHILLYIVTAIGAVLAIVGFSLLSARVNQIASIIILCFGLLFFFGGYFTNHHLTSKNRPKA